jgi:hypothetical protein
MVTVTQALGVAAQSTPPVVLVEVVVTFSPGATSN